MNFLNMEHVISGHIHGHLSHEEPLLHDEPYGYERSDDPFEPHGKFDAPLLFLVMGMVTFIHFNFTHFNFFHQRPGTVMMHQRITAGMLEDEIRKIRIEDYEVRYGSDSA